MYDQRNVHLYTEKEWSVYCDVCSKLVAVGFKFESAIYVAMFHAHTHKVSLSLCSCPRCLEEVSHYVTAYDKRHTCSCSDCLKYKSDASSF